MLTLDCLSFSDTYAFSLALYNRKHGNYLHVLQNVTAKALTVTLSLIADTSPVN